MKNLGDVLLVLTLVVISSLFGGVAFQNLWSWFIVPIFEVSKLTLGQAMGLSFFITYFNVNVSKPNENEFSKEFILKTILSSFIYTTGVLGIGWLLSLFV